MELAFWLANLAVLPFWGLMIFAPHWSWTKRIIASPLIVLQPAGGIVNLIAEFGSPRGITALAAVPEHGMVLWVHILMFDLFAGRWIYLESRERGYSALWVSPLLGFLVYLVVRTLHKKNVMIQHAV